MAVSIDLNVHDISKSLNHTRIILQNPKKLTFQHFVGFMKHFQPKLSKSHYFKMSKRTCFFSILKDNSFDFEMRLQYCVN